MGIAGKYNKGKVFDFTIPENFEYKSLSDLYSTKGSEAVYTVKALYINTKSKFGKSPVIATTECLVNAPAHLMDIVNVMLMDEEVIDAINNNKFGFKIYQYEDKKFNRICYSINWVDIE